MTVGLVPLMTDEQAMLVDASTRFMAAEVPLSVVRARADGAPRDDTAYLRTAAELGWFGLLAEEAHGGGSVSGNGVVDAALVASERGARLQPGPFPGHCAVVGALSAARGAHPALAELVTGRAWATWAHDDHRRCRLRSTAGGPRLAGEVGVVADADRCGWLLVPAGSERGAVVVLVSTTAPGVGLRPLDGLDVSRSWCAVTFDDVVVGPEAVVGGAGPAVEALEAEWLLVGATLTAAESVGAMRADLDAAVQYAKDRIAFGRPIGSFQAVKHLLADASLWTEMAMGLVVAAARALGERSPDGAQLAHAAKAFVAEHGVALAHDCFQVFGGIGYTWEHDQHLYLRRLAADAGCFGSAGWHRGRMLEGLGV